MKTTDKWLDIGGAINFAVSLYLGGGLGDLAHRLYDSHYLRALPDIKRVFPNIKVYLYLDCTRDMESAKDLFNTNPYIDEVIAYSQVFYHQDLHKFISEKIGGRITEFNKYLPGMDADVVFQRSVNRAYTLLSFPRTRTITMDDFFQQLGLDIEDFQADEPQLYSRDGELKYGVSIVDDLGSNGNRVAGVHLFAGDTNKMITTAQVKAVMDSLLDQGYNVIIFGTAGESQPERHMDGEFKDTISVLKGYADNPRVKYLCNDDSIRLKASVIRNCNRFVSVDSGLMHLAWLYGIPTLSIFGESIPDERFNIKTGYYWAIAEKKSYAGYIKVSAETEIGKIL